MPLKVSIDARGMAYSVKYMEKLLHDAKRGAVTGIAKAALKTIIKLTPPKTLAQGRAAVANQVASYVTPVEKKTWASIQDQMLKAKLERATRRRDVGMMQSLMMHLGSYWRRRASGYIAYDKAGYNARRDARGRVRGGYRQWTFDSRKVKQDVRRWQGNVGRAKGGWGQGAKLLGINLPTYARKHRGDTGDAAVIGGRVGSVFGFEFTNIAVRIPHYVDRVVKPQIQKWGRRLNGRMSAAMIESAEKAGFAVAVKRTRGDATSSVLGNYDV